MKDNFRHVWAITAHGESPYLEECILSLKAQSIPSEIIICTATDNSLIRSLSQKYDIPMHVKAGKDIVRENWNYAYNIAEGNWVTLAHQDDIYAPNYVEELKRHAQGAQDAAIFFSDYEPFGTNNKGARRNKIIESIIKIPLLVRPLSKSKFIKCFTLAMGNAICCPTVSFHKEFLGRDLFLNADQNNIHENLDWELWIILAKQKNRFLYSPKELLRYRLHEGQETAIYIDNSRRVGEDYACFRLIWPKPIADLLMRFYKKAYDVY